MAFLCTLTRAVGPKGLAQKFAPRVIASKVTQVVYIALSLLQFGVNQLCLYSIIFNYCRRGASSHRLPFQKWYVSSYPTMVASCWSNHEFLCDICSVCCPADAFDGEFSPSIVENADFVRLLVTCRCDRLQSAFAKGEAGTDKFRIFFKRDGKVISPWHELPHSPAPGLYTMVNEIPRGYAWDSCYDIARYWWSFWEQRAFHK